MSGAPVPRLLETGDQRGIAGSTLGLGDRVFETPVNRFIGIIRYLGRRKTGMIGGCGLILGMRMTGVVVGGGEYRVGVDSTALTFLRAVATPHHQEESWQIRDR